MVETELIKKQRMQRYTHAFGINYSNRQSQNKSPMQALEPQLMPLSLNNEQKERSYYNLWALTYLYKQRQIGLVYLDW